MSEIQIIAGDVSLRAELADNETARAILEALPLEGKASTWGDEIYFGIPVHLEAAPDARADVEVGELGFWPAGHAFCLFFGPTPASQGDAPRAASPVNVFGQLHGEPSQLRQVEAGDLIRVELALA